MPLTDELEQKLHVVATKVLRRERSPTAPDGHWCLSAVDVFGDKTKGPWFRYGDEHWQCEMCNTDEYLSEYGDKYLLSGNGMLALIDALQRTSMDYIEIVCTGMHPIEVTLKSPGWGASGYGASFPEAFVRAAYAATFRAEFRRDA